LLNKYQILSQYCDILPADGIAPAYPFGGWVVNLNVSTLIHRDYQDLKLCLVVVASDCEGGDLCLEKPRVAHQETGKSYMALTRTYRGYTYHVALSIVPIAPVSLHVKVAQ
jgi:hypothetical protein